MSESGRSVVKLARDNLTKIREKKDFFKMALTANSKLFVNLFSVNY